MPKRRPLTFSVIFLIALAVFLCFWLLLVAPVFQEKERLVRSENAALTKDLAEITAMDGSTEELVNSITDTENAIRHKYASRADNADDAKARIESICAGLGLYPSKIALGPAILLHPAGAFTPALYSVDITFLIESAEDSGAAVIRGLESSASADFEVTGFVYRALLPDPIGEDEEEDEEEDIEPSYSGEWIFSVTLYFYD